MNFLDRFSKNRKKRNFVLILTVGVQLFYAGGQTDRRTDGQADRRTGGQRDRRTGGQADRRTGGQTDRRTGGQADRRLDRHEEARSPFL